MTTAALDDLQRHIRAGLQSATQRTYVCGAATVGVVTSSADVTTMVEDFYAPQLPAALDMTIAVVVDAAATALAYQIGATASTPPRIVAHHMDYNFDAHDISAQTTLLLPQRPRGALLCSGREVTIVAESDRSASDWTTWVLREIALRSLENLGGHAVRAAAVEHRGGAVLIMGEKYAGKSTLATWLIEHAGARPMENGIVVCVPEPQGVRAHALPMPYRLADGTIQGSAALTAAQSRSDWMLGRDSSDGKLEMTPREFAEIFATTSVASALVSAVVLPERVDASRSGLRRLSGVPARRVVPQTTFPSDYLGLANGGGATTLPATTAPVHRLRWSPETLDSVAARLVRTLDRGAPKGRGVDV